MKSAIISVGEEVLRAEISNTNTSFLAKSLIDAGIDPCVTLVVGDIEAGIIKALETATSCADLIITIGGLGPTPDDLTRETVAKYLGRQMVFDPEIAKAIDAIFARRNMETPQTNYRQAYIIEGSSVLGNDFGTAPGLMVKNNDKTYVILPGPPRELIPMWENLVLPNIAMSERTYSSDFHVYGLTESETAFRLDRLMKSTTEPFVAPYANIGDVRLRVWGKAKNKDDFDIMAKPVIDEMFEKLSPCLFYDQIEVELGKLLISKSLTISTAESCTGGLIAKTITDVAGSSTYFMGSAVTYANSAKMKLLGVSSDSLEKFGAVSEQVATEMVQGCAKLFGTSCAISTTGIAGPDGGTPEKPVGLVYVGLLTPKGTKVHKLLFSGTRADVRHRTLMFALTEMLLSLKQ